MVPDLDIWRATNLPILKHGADAELEAAKRAGLMLDRGDDEGQHLWARHCLKPGGPSCRHGRGHCVVDLITLVVPADAELAPISHGDQCFEPYREHWRTGQWLVDVPVEAATHFCKVGGFYLYQPPSE